MAVGETDWLGRINEIRAGSGLPAVSENPAWTAGILAHLNYLAGTPAEYRTGEYASAHTENPASPYYTEAGAIEAQHSDLAEGGTQSPLAAINAWLAAPFHAIGILRPALRQVAFGRDPDDGAAGLDVISGLEFSEGVPPQEVLFPGNGSTIDLNRFYGEYPTPIQTCEAEHPGADYSTPGLPLIAMLTEGPGPGVSAELRLPSGVAVSSAGNELCVVTAANFVSSDGVYGPTGQAILESDHAVLVIPREPLVAGTYTVTVSPPAAAALTWSFTDDPPAVETSTVGTTKTVGHGHSAPSHLGVHFGRPRFRRGFVPLRLSVPQNGATTVFRVRSSAGRSRSFKVPAGYWLKAHARIRRRGGTRVSVLVDGRTLRSRQFFRRR